MIKKTCRSCAYYKNQLCLDVLDCINHSGWEPKEQTIPNKYEKIGQELGKMVDKKQTAYGDSFGQAHRFLELLWPDGIPVESYKSLLTIARIFDKLKRIATNNDEFGESPWNDIVGYGILESGRGKK